MKYNISNHNRNRLHDINSRPCVAFRFLGCLFWVCKVMHLVRPFIRCLSKSKFASAAVRLISNFYASLRGVLI